MFNPNRAGANHTITGAIFLMTFVCVAMAWSDESVPAASTAAAGPGPTEVVLDEVAIT